jgi:hypothetical protein
MKTNVEGKQTERARHLHQRVQLDKERLLAHRSRVFSQVNSCSRSVSRVYNDVCKLLLSLAWFGFSRGSLDAKQKAGRAFTYLVVVIYSEQKIGLAAYALTVAAKQAPRAA